MFRDFRLGRAHSKEFSPLFRRRESARPVVPAASGFPSQNRPAKAGTECTLPADAGGVFSFISYRVAQVQNVAQVALEAGNSPKIIFSNYRELVKPADAVKWFGIQPDTPANVIQAPMVAVAA